MDENGCDLIERQFGNIAMKKNVLSQTSFNNLKICI